MVHVNVYGNFKWTRDAASFQPAHTPLSVITPPGPPPVQLGELQALLSTVARALKRLDGSIQTLPKPGSVCVYVHPQESGAIQPDS